MMCVLMEAIAIGLMNLDCVDVARGGKPGQKTKPLVHGTFLLGNSTGPSCVWKRGTQKGGARTTKKITESNILVVFGIRLLEDFANRRE